MEHSSLSPPSSSTDTKSVGEGLRNMPVYQVPQVIFIMVKSELFWVLRMWSRWCMWKHITNRYTLTETGYDQKTKNKMLHSIKPSYFIHSSIPSPIFYFLLECTIASLGKEGLEGILLDLLTGSICAPWWL